MQPVIKANSEAMVRDCCRHLFSHSQDSHCAKQIFFSSLSEVRHVISLVPYIKRYKHGMPARAYIVLHTTACTISTLPPSLKKKEKKEREKGKQKQNKNTCIRILQLAEECTYMCWSKRETGSVATIRNNLTQNLRQKQHEFELQCKLDQ